MSEGKDQKKDDERKKGETEAEAILKIINDPLFDEGVKMGTVPNTPRQDEGPQTDKQPKAPK